MSYDDWLARPYEYTEDEDEEEDDDPFLPCERCCGTGLTPEGWDCPNCDGTGELEI